VASLGKQRLRLTRILLALALGGTLHSPCRAATLALLNALHRLPQPLPPLALQICHKTIQAHTAATATDSACIRAGHVLKLCVVHYKYAAQIAAHARAVERHALKLVLLHARIKAEAVAIAGPDYYEHHAGGFEDSASINEQLRDTETGGKVFGTDLEDVVEPACSMANRASQVAACAVPPPLLSKQLCDK
jgi:hypothetical protein